MTLLEERPSSADGRPLSKTASPSKTSTTANTSFSGPTATPQAFLRRLGVLDRLRFEKQIAVTFINRSGRRSKLAPRLLPGRAGLLLGVLLFRELRLKDKISLLWGVLRARPPKGEKRRPSPQWLSALHQTPGTRRAFWDPFVTPPFNERPDQASAAAFVAAGGFPGRRIGQRLGHSTLPLGRLWAVELADYLRRRGGRVAARLKATRIQVDGDRVVSVDVDGAPPVRVDAVVLAASVRESWALLPESSVNATPRWPRPSRLPFWPSTSGFPVRRSKAPSWRSWTWTYNGSSIARPRPRRARADQRRLERRALPRTPNQRRIDRPGPRRRAPRFSGIHGRPAPRNGAVGAPSHAVPTPSFWAARPPVSTPLSNLVLAGDWTDVGLPPTIEAACRSGHRAAEDVLRHLKHAPGGPSCKAIIFDCDGVIADSEHLHFSLFQKVLAEEGVPLTQKNTWTTTSPWTTRDVFAPSSRPTKSR